MNATAPVAVLRARADAGDGLAAEDLAELLVGQGRGDEAVAVLRARKGAALPDP